MLFLRNFIIPNNIFSVVYIFKYFMSLSGSIFYQTYVSSSYYLFFLLWRLGALGRDNNFQLAVLKINGQSTEKLIIDVNNLFCAVFVTSICYHRKDDLLINPVYTSTTRERK